MNRLAACLVVIALAAGCAGAATPRLEVTLDQPFRLSVGATAHLNGASTEIRMLGILSDSRCPRGQQCISAGNAVVRVAVLKDGTEVTRDLRTQPGGAPSASVGALQLALVDLEPLPAAGDAPTSARQTPVATLTVSRSGSAATAQ